MAKKSAIARNEKRKRLVAQYAERRTELKRIMANPETTDEEFYEAQRKLSKLPRNSSPVRVRNQDLQPDYAPFSQVAEGCPARFRSHCNQANFVLAGGQIAWLPNHCPKRRKFLCQKFEEVC